METKAEPTLIDATTNLIASETSKNTIKKSQIIDLLKINKIETRIVQDSQVSIEDIIPTLNSAKISIPESFFETLAEMLEINFISLIEIQKLYRKESRSQLVTILPYNVIKQYNIVPIEINQSRAKFATSNPFDEKIRIVLQLLFSSWQIELCCASPKTIEWAIENVYSKIHKEKAMLDLFNRTPDQSAYKVLFPIQKYFIIGLIATIGIGLVLDALLTCTVIFALINIGYFIINPVKIWISARGFQKLKTPTHITKGEIDWTLNEDLPIYTILVPIYHEAKVLPQILRNLSRLNYPREKLDVKILMEESDSETLDEAKKLGLFGSPTKKIEDLSEDEYGKFLEIFDPVVVPSAKITTKPRACNYGLLRAKGELCVIYDAEDEPHPDQLIKAAIVFLRSENDVVCLQSKLNFYNANENILTKWFSIEYGYWYEFYLPGLDYVDAPIPLGGTSNHFRISKLDELGRWDPYNVTEDADIGIRLARFKFKTQIIKTYTYEEATISVKSWIRQRSRWNKGHLQTYLVHMRHPIRLLKDLGAIKYAKFQLTFGGGIIMPLLNPFLWALSILTLVSPSVFGILFPAFIQPVCIFNLVIGNLTYLLLYVVACIKRKQYDAVPCAIVMPIYWALISIASWRGLIQLIRKPFYWDKTSHGLSKTLQPAKT